MRCSTSELNSEKINMKEKYDAIIIMGRNWRGYPKKHQPFIRHETKEKFLDLSIPAKINCQMAAEFYKQGLAKYIVFGTGKTAGKDWPSEAQAIKNYISRAHPEIPKEKILIHEKNLDSYEEIKQDVHILQEKGLVGKIALITIDTQLPKAIKMFKREGITNVDAYDSLQEISKKSHRHKRIVDNYQKSEAAIYERKKERILSVADSLGFRGWFFGPLAKLTRS